MAHRIPLPRLTQSQRTTRWQRERRQQAVIIIGFSTALLVALALLAWSAADRFYQQNLKAAGLVGGLIVPYRDYNAEVNYQLVKFYQDNGVPKGFENDQQIAPQKLGFEASALSAVIEAKLLNGEARANGISPTAAQVDARYISDFGQFRSRHILVSPDSAATDKDAADKAALAKATDLAKQLRATPRDDALWKTLAAASSADPGSKEQGGELGWVGTGQFVKEFETVAKAQQPYDVSDPVKSSFGYHVIQVEERRGPENNELVARWLRSGVSVGAIKEHARTAVIRDELRTRAETAVQPSPIAQVRVAKIFVSIPRPTSGDFTNFSNAMGKLSTVTTELDKPNADFQALAKQHSDDSTATNGGELGWLVRGMLSDVAAETELFSIPAGKVSTQYSKSGGNTVYKVLEKDPARVLTDDQKASIKSLAYEYWLETLKAQRGVQRLVQGHEFD